MTDIVDRIRDELVRILISADKDKPVPSYVAVLTIARDEMVRLQLRNELLAQGLQAIRQQVSEYRALLEQSRSATVVPPTGRGKARSRVGILRSPSTPRPRRRKRP